MEFPAASVLRGCVPWLGLLLAVFLLTFWIMPTTAQFAIDSTIAFEGQDAILHLRNKPPYVTGFIWYRGIETKFHNFILSLAWDTSEFLTGPEYSGREEINLDGSLIIRNVTARDQDIYVVVAVLPMSGRVRGSGWLIVYCVGWGEFYFTHRTASPRLSSISLCIMSQAGFGNLVQDTHSGDKYPKVRVPFLDSSPTDIHHREKEQFDGSEGAELEQPLSGPCQNVLTAKVLGSPSAHPQEISPGDSLVKSIHNKCLLFEQLSFQIFIHSPIFSSNPSGLIRCLWIPRSIIVSYPSYLGVFRNKLPSEQSESGLISLRGPLSVPTLLASNTTVTENEDAVVMTCHTDGSSINWLFNAMSLLLTERMKLSQDHRTLTIDPVRREDAGNYQCKVSNPFSSTESVPVELDVK
uniref:Ig-like domain-containing protein n=1 Tax=Myotis lucifugus TaxID=59463 RepID=L7N1Q7_MYOLU